jgi:hypothetical protein
MNIWHVWTPHEFKNFQCIGLVALPNVCDISGLWRALVQKGFLYEDSAGKISMTRDEYTIFVSDKKTGKPLYNLYSAEYVH